MSTNKALSLVSKNQKCQHNLIVKIIGIRKKQGQLCLSLFNSKQGFPNNGDKAIKTYSIEVTDTQATINFPNLAEGSYAVAVFHDENNDGVLNCNWLGIPIEGFGFSNNPRILKGIPKFKNSAVIVDDSDTNIEIKLKYIL